MDNDTRNDAFEASQPGPTVEEFVHNDAQPHKRSSRPRVEVGTDSGASSPNTNTTASSPNNDVAEDAKEAMRRALKSPSGFFEENFPGHGNAVLFGLIGLIVAILLFWVGLWRALVVGILILLGVSYGQYLDGKPSIINSFKKLLWRFLERRDNK